MLNHQTNIVKISDLVTVKIKTEDKERAAEEVSSNIRASMKSKRSERKREEF